MSRFLFNYFILIAITFPVHRSWQVYALQCYACNSVKQPACVDNPAELNSFSECKSPDTCATAIIDRAIHRGCTSSVAPSGSCSSNSWRPCKTCDTPLCNGQIFPEDRLLCYQCKDDCHNVTKARIKPTPCRTYDKDEQCYYDAMSIHMARRGCFSEMKDKNKCQEPRCVKCKSSGCNDVLTLTEHLCYSCQYLKSVTSSKDPSCKRAQYATEKCTVSELKTCANKVLPGDKTKCYTWYNSNTDVVQRGCSQTKGALWNGNLTECDGDLCNNQCVDIKCLDCDSKKDYKCINSTTHMQAKACLPGTNSCFAAESKDGHVIRGCGSGTPNEYHHIPCYGDDGCNRQPIRTCYRCSSAINPNCAKWENTTSVGLETCNNPQDECVTTVKPTSYTVRGCWETVAECTNSDPFCIRCKGSLCNEGIVPKARMHCSQCRGSDECDKGLIKATPCTNFDVHDYCYAYTDTYDQMVRGCYSDDSFNSCKKLDGRCKVCYENECNLWPQKRKPVLSCVKCEQKNEACAWGHSEQSAKLCISWVPYFQDEACFTYTHQNGNVSRGCIVDHPEFLTKYDGIQICHKSGCNYKSNIVQSCIQCSTKNGQLTCGDKQSNNSSTNCECDEVMQTFERRGCYMQQYDGNSTVRGCSCQLKYEKFNKCKAGMNLCVHCTGKSCNTEKLTGSSNVQDVNVPLMVFSCAIITAMLRRE